MFVVFALLVISQLFVNLHSSITQIKTNNKPLVNPLKHSPIFILGTLSCTVGFGLMTLIMNAAPLSMHNHAYPISQNATVLQWHFVAMYLPCLFFSFYSQSNKNNTPNFAG